MTRRELSRYVLHRISVHSVNNRPPLPNFLDRDPHKYPSGCGRPWWCLGSQSSDTAAVYIIRLVSGRHADHRRARIGHISRSPFDCMSAHLVHSEPCRVLTSLQSFTLSMDTSLQAGSSTLVQRTASIDLIDLSSPTSEQSRLVEIADSNALVNPSDCWKEPVLTEHHGVCFDPCLTP